MSVVQTPRKRFLKPSTIELLWRLAIGGIVALFPPSGESASDRSPAGLQVLYDFRETSGNRVGDHSGVGEPIDLEIADPKTVVRQAGSLQVTGTASIRSAKPATRLTEAVLRSGEITIEAWLQPASASLEGPARIVTLSKSTSERLFTLGQDKDRYDVRFRTDKTDKNGSPSLSSPAKSLAPRLSHVVYTLEKGGRARFFIDGKQVAERTVVGGLAPWKQPLQLALGDEIGGGRAWSGTFHLVAIYTRRLSDQEIQSHFKAGPKAKVGAPSMTDRSGDLFEKKVASLLATRCLECHDPGTREGKLDLSRKTTAFAEAGTIVPGKSAESLLWEVVDSDEMPEDRDPLTAEEKKLLREWIDGGASWSVAVIDPANYRHQEVAAENWVRRLTVDEYIETVSASVGIDIADEAREMMPADLRTDGFTNTAYNLGVDLGHVEAYARLARLIVEQMDAPAFAKRFSKTQSVEDDDMRKLIAAMGTWLLRGPLEDSEIVTYRGITTTVSSAGGDFRESVAFLIEAMLQSPRFLYRIEKQRGDGSRWPVSDYELASRLSYAIWGASPDGELMRLAQENQLSRTENLRAQVDRMLKDPRAEEQSVRFLSEWLDLDRLRDLRPSPEKFPGWNPALAADMRAETIAFFKEVAWEQKRPLTDLLNAPVTFVTPRLARHYGLSAEKGMPADGDSPELVRVDLDGVPSRGGLLTHGSVLTIGGEEASMVTRGLFVFHDLLRGTVNNPPPGLNVEPVPTKTGQTHRNVAEDRVANANCSTCHGKFEPLAFGLEKFDGLGAWRERDEHGNPLREDGEVRVPGTDKTVSYRNASELMDLLAGSDRVAESLTWKLAQFVAGRPLTATDAPLILEVHAAARKKGGTYQDLMTTLVTSDLVLKTRTVRDD